MGGVDNNNNYTKEEVGNIMALNKISTFIVSILIVSMVVGIYAIFLSNMRDGYGDVEGMTEEDLALFNKLDGISEDAKEIQDSVNAVTDKDNPFDIIGNYFSAAWGSVRLAGTTVDVVAGTNGSIVETAVDKANLGAGGDIIRNTLTTIVIVLVVIGILLSVLIKRQL